MLIAKFQKITVLTTIQFSNFKIHRFLQIFSIYFGKREVSLCMRKFIPPAVTVLTHS